MFAQSNKIPKLPFEIGQVQLEDESGAAGLVFHLMVKINTTVYPTNGSLRLTGLKVRMSFLDHSQLSFPSVQTKDGIVSG